MNSYNPGSGGVEINLSSSDKSSSGWDANAKTSLTHSPEGTNTGFRSMDYVPGSGGTYAAVGSGVQQPPTQQEQFESGVSGIVDAGGGGEASDNSQKTSPVRILVIILVTGALAGAGLGIMTFVEEGGELSVDGIMAFIMGNPAEELSRPVPIKNPGPEDNSDLSEDPPTKPSEGTEPAPLDRTLTDGMDSSIDMAGEDSGKPYAESPQKYSRSGAGPEEEKPAVLEHLPYLYLVEKNLTDMAEADPMGPIWSAQQEEAWRRGIMHKFPWQRYKTVMEVKNSRLVQSRVILWDALEDDRFWTRIRAVMALAEFGVRVSLGVVKRAMDGAPKPAAARFFKRFLRKNSAGERHVMRVAMALVTPKGRMNILRALWRFGGTLENHGLYLAAAMEDPDHRVRKLAKKMGSSTPPQWLSRQRKVFMSLTKNPVPEVEATEPGTPRKLNDSLEPPPIEVDQIQIFDSPREPEEESAESEEYDVRLDDF